jgi:zinc D-Ala-D-Ala carboxypeptidase
MKLSNHFNLSEMTFSQTAVRRGINNDPPDAVIQNLTALCEKVLEPLREAAGATIRISSGYRSEKLNAAVKGAKNSQHVTGQAVDLTVHGLSVADTVALVRKLNLPVDQVIDEFSSWVHISYATGANRGQYLKARKVNGRTVYSPN